MTQTNTTDDFAGFFLGGWYVFSSFAPFQIEWQGKPWPTAEHAYQAAHFFTTDPKLAELIRAQKSPYLAKMLANANEDKEDPLWSTKKLAIMEEICRAKLQQHELVRETLRASGHKVLIETNDMDAFWGWGQDHQGRNELGSLWMRLRDEL